MNKHLLLTAIVVLLTCPVQGTPRTVDKSAEEYAVYSAAIANMFETRSKLLVIQDATNTDFTEPNSKLDDQSFRRLFPTLAEGVVKDYKAKNNRPVRLKDSFKLNVKHVLVDEQEIVKIFKGSGSWDDFYKRYPDSGGLIVLSRVGFNAAMNQTMVYIQHACGGLCGSGHYVLLEKNADQWRVVKESMVWVS